MITAAHEKDYAKLQPNISTIPENNENLPSNVQIETKSIDSKSVKLADSKSKLLHSKSKPVDSKMKAIDTISLKEPVEEKEEYEEESTKLNCLTGLEPISVLDEQLSLEASSQESDSDFGDVECGEPNVTRQLTVDFTIKEEDTDFVQQKCCEFWDFIYSNPHLQHLMVTPEEPDQEVKAPQEELVLESASTPSASTPPAMAIEILHNKEEAVAQAFAAKQPVICRNQDFRNYCHGSCARLDKEMMRKLKHEEATKSRSKKSISFSDMQPHRTRSPTFLASLCSELEAWDLQHPKSSSSTSFSSLNSQLEAWDLQHPKSFDPPSTLVSCLCSPEPVPQSASLEASKEPVCSPDMMCVPCSPSTEEVLKMDKRDAEVRADE